MRADKKHIEIPLFIAILLICTVISASVFVLAPKDITEILTPQDNSAYLENKMQKLEVIDTNGEICEIEVPQIYINEDAEENLAINEKNEETQTEDKEKQSESLNMDNMTLNNRYTQLLGYAQDDTITFSLYYSTPSNSEWKNYIIVRVKYSGGYNDDEKYISGYRWTDSQETPISFVTKTGGYGDKNNFSTSESGECYLHVLTTEGTTAVGGPYYVDKQAPEITTVEGNPTDWTKEDVTLTINAEDTLSGLHTTPYSFDGGATWQAENTKTYTENTEGIQIKVRDAVENIATYVETININKIDKEAPEITTVEENPTDWTKEDVTLTINAEDTLSGLHETAYSFDGGATWQAENAKTYTKNTEGIQIKVRDVLENIATYAETININKIDKEAPEITTVEGNPTDWTKEDVTLTINAEDTLSGLHETAYSFDGGATWQAENAKTYTKNTEGIQIKVRDVLENIAVYEETININKIDKEAPEITTVEGNLTDWTKEDVTLTINAKDRLSCLHETAYSFDGGTTWQAENTKTYTENTEGIQIKVRDAVENIAVYEETININKIDKEAPEITTVEGNPTDWTKEDATITINAEDTLSGLHETAYSFDGGATWQAENTKTYTENTEGIQIKVRDALKNIATHTETIEINKILVLESISIKSNPDKVDYKVGEKLDTTGLTIELKYNSGLTEEITSGFTIAPADGTTLDKAETKEIIVTYQEKTTSFNIYVTEETQATIESEIYTIDSTYIKRIQPNTTFTSFKNNVITTSKTMKVRDKNGNILGATDIVATGMTLILDGNKTYTLVVIGDVNGDGQANLFDILNINKHRLNKTQLTGEYLLAGDVIENNTVDLFDLLQINKYRLRKISQL